MNNRKLPQGSANGKPMHQKPVPIGKRLPGLAFAFACAGWFLSFIPAQAKAELLFTEILQDVPGFLSESDSEWFEIFNSGPTAIDLNGYSITDGGNNSVTVNQSLVAQPGDYLVFARSDDEAESGLPFTDYLFDFSLNNNGETLALRDASSNLLDEVSWGEATGGHAFYLSGTDPTVDNNDMSFWLTSQLAYHFDSQGVEAAYGTPGSPNDNGSLTYTTVPEPSTAVFVAAVLGLTILRQRKRRSLCVKFAKV